MLSVCGNNDSYQILHETFKNIKIPTNFQIDLSFLSSISFYNRHTVWVTKDGRAYAVGSNREGRISGTLPHEEFSTKRSVMIHDEFGHQCDFRSVVCGHNYTLYQLCSRSQFVYVHEIDPKPQFLTIEGPKSISLYGGSTIAASIDTEGGILIFTPYLVKFKVKEIKSIKLPFNEKAIFVSCCSSSILVLSASGKLFESKVNLYASNEVSFKEVKELSKKKIVKISGSNDHFLALCNKGKVYAKGSNMHGQLGIGTGKLTLEKFTLVESLQHLQVTTVSAGYYHSLFQTKDGKIYACGSNYDGQLFDGNGKDHYIYNPTETTVHNGATFCIAGENISAAFIDTPDLPPHMPNMPIKSRSEDEDDVELDTRNDVDDLFSYNKSDLIKKIVLLQQENEVLKSALKRALKSAKKTNYNIINKSQFNGYKIIRKINEGGFGIVFEVEKEGKKYALKQLRDSVIDPRNIKGFKSEYMKINKLHHPNVIKTFGIYLEEEEDKSPSFILEYCPKVLSKMVGNPEEHKEQIVIWLFQIAEAMKYIHNNEMVHLDLKPANILIDSNGFIKISDFGISVFMNPLERTTQLGSGTRFYAAPEFINFEDITEKFDVYSFGVIVFELLCGKLPVQDIRKLRVRKKCTFPSNFNQFAKNLISSCCEFNPEERPSFEEVLDMLEENDYALFNMKKDEINKIKDFVVNHRKRIAKDSE